MKKYNKSTGCYKIDVFIDGVYLWSTDQCKTCRQAKVSAIYYMNFIAQKEFNKISARFDTV